MTPEQTLAMRAVLDTTARLERLFAPPHVEGETYPVYSNEFKLVLQLWQQAHLVADIIEALEKKP